MWQCCVLHHVPTAAASGGAPGEVPAAGTEALCTAGAAALLLSAALRSSYSREHDAHISSAGSGEKAGINSKPSAIQAGEVSLRRSRTAFEELNQEMVAPHCAT